jgi:1-hydroxycarotenoid 3,4-desaturase
MSTRDRVAIIGAGIAGLTAAIDLARQGLKVAVIERAEAPGGKMRELAAGAARVDAGPTVLTMARVFESLFSDAGRSLSAYCTLRPAEILARHAWSERERLDLFADRERSQDAIGAFAGPGAARGYRRFCEDAGRVFRTLDHSFMRRPAPRLESLIAGAGWRGLGDLWQIKPFVTLWAALGAYFDNPRLRQLFGRYATYCGSSPFRAPATLMLVAHVEQEGVWLVEGGMHRLARALARLAEELGATIRYGAEAREILTSGGRVRGVRLADGEIVEADAVVHNGDVAALAHGLLGATVAPAAASVPAAARSLSAVTWAMTAQTSGFPLARHTVFFSDDYAAEFDDILARRRLPANPTVYVCAQDRGDGIENPTGAERLLCLINAPRRATATLSTKWRSSHARRAPSACWSDAA